MEERPSYEAEVPLCQIGALSASKGGYLMHLDRLPETMDLRNSESYGPLADSEMKRLKTAVFREFGVHNGRFELSLQDWDQLYAGMNSGASRRFPLAKIEREQPFGPCFGERDTVSPQFETSPGNS